MKWIAFHLKVTKSSLLLCKSQKNRLTDVTKTQDLKSF